MLDPKIKEFLTNLEAKNNPALSEISVDQARTIDRLLVEELQAGIQVPQALTVRDSSILVHWDTAKSTLQPHSIPIRHYIPKTKSGESLIVFFHGGGWVYGNIQTSDIWCRNMAFHTGIAVVSVEYRCAPEYKFPTPFEDCYATYEWIASHIEDFDTIPGKIALCGDSAGGNLATAVCLEAKKRSGPGIAAQFLIYPVTDLSSMTTQSYIDYSHGMLLTFEAMQWFKNQYLAEDNDSLNPLVSPLLAEDLAGLPPTVIITAKCDPLRDEAAAYAERLKTSGVQVSYKCYDKLIHAFIHMEKISPVAATAIKDMFQIFRSFLQD